MQLCLLYGEEINFFNFATRLNGNKSVFSEEFEFSSRKKGASAAKLLL
jgi:hypothetical protein